MSENLSAQRSVFEDIWQASKNNWPPPAIEDAYVSEICWTILSRANSTVAQALSSLTSVMSQRWPRHIYYGTNTFHLTLLGLGEPGSSCELQAISGCLKEALENSQPITVEICGINVLKSTVVAQAFDHNDSLRNLVADVQAKLAEHSMDLSTQIGLHNKCWWLSIARLKENAEEDLLEFVDKRRELPLGRMNISKVEFVQTDGLFSPAKTSVFFTFDY